MGILTSKNAMLIKCSTLFVFEILLLRIVCPYPNILNLPLSYLQIIFIRFIYFYVILVVPIRFLKMHQLVSSCISLGNV